MKHVIQTNSIKFIVPPELENCIFMIMPISIKIKDTNKQ